MGVYQTSDNFTPFLTPGQTRMELVAVLDGIVGEQQVGRLSS